MIDSLAERAIHDTLGALQSYLTPAARQRMPPASDRGGPDDHPCGPGAGAAMVLFGKDGKLVTGNYLMSNIKAQPHAGEARRAARGSCSQHAGCTAPRGMA